MWLAFCQHQYTWFIGTGIVLGCLLIISVFFFRKKKVDAYLVYLIVILIPIWAKVVDILRFECH